MSKPKIVVIGGGTGLPVVLKSLRNREVDITAIVTVADDGGSSGILRESLNCSPPGDLRNVLVALSEMPRFYEKLCQYRFREDSGEFTNHPIGNLLIAAVAQMQDSMYKAIQLLSKMMHIDGNVYPATDQALTLHAVFTDGTSITGESKIAGEAKQIDHVYVTDEHGNRKIPACRQVIQSIEAADLVVLGPGSLFTSVLPNLMIPEIGKALKQTAAKVVYICNLMTQRGETEFFTDADHIRVLHQHLNEKFVDVALVNREKILEEHLDAKNYDEYLLQVAHDIAGLREEKVQVVSANFLNLKNGGAFHNGEQIVEELFALLSAQKEPSTSC